MTKPMPQILLSSTRSSAPPVVRSADILVRSMSQRAIWPGNWPERVAFWSVWRTGMSALRWRWRVAPRTSVLAALLCVAVIGCQSAGKPASAPFAAVRIRGHTAEQIRAATVVVFRQEGYTAVDVHGAEMIFEKQGTEWDRIVHGSWIDQASVQVRVRVSAVPVFDGVLELQCQAFRVQHKGDAVFEEEVRLKQNRSKPYQALLDKVPGQLAR